MFTLLKGSEITPGNPAYRFMVEVASNTHDHGGIPLDVRTIDLLESKPTREAITLTIADMQLLKDYSLMNYWIGESGGSEL